MKEAGQFLISPSVFLNSPTDYVYIGIALTVIGILFIWRALRFRISRETTLFFFRGIVLSSVISIPVTYVMTYMGLFSYQTAQPLVDFMASFDISRISGYTRHIMGPLNQISHSGAGKKAAAIPVGVAFLLLTLFVIGAGYAFTEIKLSLFSQFLAMSAGVGLPEEVAKSSVGLLIVLWVAKSKGVYDQKVQQCACPSFASSRLVILGCFTASGLGFGMGEALKYFSYYASHDLGFYAFLLRALWCVPLHGAWCMLSGICFYQLRRATALFTDSRNGKTQSVQNAGRDINPFCSRPRTL